METLAALAVGLFSFVWFGAVVGVDPEIAGMLALTMAMATLALFVAGA